MDITNKHTLFLQSIKANSVCGQIRKNFNHCRATAMGRIADPSYCKPAADTLIQCFQQVKSSTDCTTQFTQALNCLDSGSYFTTCQVQIQSYSDCHLQTEASFKVNNNFNQIPVKMSNESIPSLDEFEQDRMGEVWEFAEYTANVNYREDSEFEQEDQFEAALKIKSPIIPLTPIQPATSNYTPKIQPLAPLPVKQVKNPVNKRIDLKTRGMMAQAKLQQAEMKAHAELIQEQPDIVIDDPLENGVEIGQDQLQELRSLETVGKPQFGKQVQHNFFNDKVQQGNFREGNPVQQRGFNLKEPQKLNIEKFELNAEQHRIRTPDIENELNALQQFTPEKVNGNQQVGEKVEEQLRGIEEKKNIVQEFYQEERRIEAQKPVQGETDKVGFDMSLFDNTNEFLKDIPRNLGQNKKQTEEKTGCFSAFFKCFNKS